jgi:curved DNA-binding protein CbpA
VQHGATPMFGDNLSGLTYISLYILKMRYFFNPPPREPDHICDHPDCNEAGLYKAPKSRHNLREYYYFCLDHVRDYNRGWNFFADFDENKMYEQMRADVSWERPSWPSHISQTLENRLRKAAHFWGGPKADPIQNQKTEPQIKNPVREAFSTLGLETDTEFLQVKKQFRVLVKKYHPDTNQNDPKATERFKTINAAYALLKAHFSEYKK